MSLPTDVESGSVNTESQASTTQESTFTNSDISATNLPLMLVSAFQDEQLRHKVETLPKLPSHRFRYSVWHDLTNTEITGSELKAPRVRYGPPEKEKYFYKIRDENNQRIHHNRRGRDCKDYRDKTEDWENTKYVSLSYQELGHNYQMDTFLRVLKRCFRAEEVTLIHNELTTLKGLAFPVCYHLNVNDNYISSLKRLPKVSRVEHLLAEDNYIEDLSGLSSLGSSPIKTLSLRGNPVTFTLNYRQRVFAELPQLKVLDRVPRTPEDDHWEDEEDGSNAGKTCVIS